MAPGPDWRLAFEGASAAATGAPVGEARSCFTLSSVIGSSGRRVTVVVMPAVGFVVRVGGGSMVIVVVTIGAEVVDFEVVGAAQGDVTHCEYQGLQPVVRIDVGGMSTTLLTWFHHCSSMPAAHTE